MSRVRTKSNALSNAEVPLRSRNDVLSQSGIYPSSDANQLGWDDDDLATLAYSARPEPASPQTTRQARLEDEEPTTNVFNRYPVQRANVVVAPVTSTGQPMWQVGMLLRGDEFTRLWLQNASQIGDRMWVWSEPSKRWVGVEAAAALGASDKHGQPSDGSPAPAAVTRDRVALKVGDAVDVTEYATLRARLSYPMILSWLMPVALGCIAAWSLVANRSSELSPELLDWALEQESRLRPAAETLTETSVDAQLNGATRTVDSPEIVAVESLPLLRTVASHPLAKRPSVTEEVLAAAEAPRGPFDANLARRVLNTAVARASRCTARPVSGSVQVTFSSGGSVTNVQIRSASGTLATTTCVTGAFRAVRVSPFNGSEVTVRKSFVTG